MTATSLSKLGGTQAWFNWVVAVSFVVLVFTLQTGYAITNASVAQDLGLTIAQVGFVGTIYTWAFALMQLTSGSILDKLGTRWVLPIACLIVACGAFLFANSTGPWTLVIANVLAAIGASFGFIGAGFVGGQWFAPIKYGLMFSLVQFVASLSAIVGQRVLGSLIQITDWTVLINGLGVIGLGIALIMTIFLREPIKETTLSKTWPGLKTFISQLFDSLGQVAAVRDTWINAIIGGATMGTMLGIGVVWGPRLLTAGGMDQGQAFQVTSLAWAGLAFGAPTFAWLSDRFKSRTKPMQLGCILQFSAIIIILIRPTASSAEASVWFFLFGFMAGGSMLPFTIGAELVPPSLVGTSAAVVNATQFIVGGIMMAVPGRVLGGTGLIARLHESVSHLDTAPTGTVSDFQWAIAIMPVMLAIGIFLCLFLKETYPANSS